MEKDQARLLLESLIQRIERDVDSGKWRVTGPVSELELEALNDALVALGGMAPASGPIVHRVPVPRARAMPLVTKALERTTPADQEVLLCLDFGTAMSKAAATVSKDGDLGELALGKRAGDGASVYGLRSSIFVSRSGRIYFGHEAISKSINETDGSRQRFDSLKQRLSQGEQRALSESLVDRSINPTSVPLTQGDLILLYLAYLTDMATTELAENTKKSRYVRRRFARPCWESSRAAWAEGELRIMLAKAQILADTFQGQWIKGIAADVAKATIDAVAELDQQPDYLVADGVLEPIAAAASRMASDDKDRGLFVVVDVGAGTTDFAVFWANQDPTQNIYKVWQIQGTVDAISQAGDTIDGFLHSHILEKGHLKSGMTDYAYAATRLSLEIRQHKESLFRDGELNVTLSNSTPVSITIADFLKQEGVIDFGSLVRDRFIGVLNSAPKSWLELVKSFVSVERDSITVVLTGGGAGLPMIRELANQPVDVHGIRLKCIAAIDVPEWITDSYPALRGEYAQLAVAIGGAARLLPELAPAVSEIRGLGGPPGWELKPTYKK